MSTFVAISNARAHLPNLVKKVSKDMDRFLITVKGKPEAALLSLEELESLEETQEIMAIPGALESIKRGENEIRDSKLVSFESLVGKSPSEILKAKKSV